MSRFGAAWRDLRVFSRQFWILTIAIFTYCAAAALAFPFEGIYLRTHLHTSMTSIGLVFGLVPLVLMPVQFWAGHLTDRVGRRPLIVLSAFAGVVWFVGFAYARSVWQVGVLVGVDIAFGWPLFQTASNAMIADLVEPEHRAEAYSVTRVAMNLGVVLGPAVAGLALSQGVSFFQLFISAALGCLVFGGLAGLWIRESRPQSAVTAGRAGDDEGRSGYAIVLADRRFLLFCAVALLPVFVIGNFGSIYSVFITDVLGVAYGTWGLLLAMNALIVAVLQYPLIRATRRADPMLLLAFSSLLLGIGIGGSALVGPLWPLVMLVVVMSCGQIFLAPVAATVVSGMAPEAVRGRYMGVWTVVWNGGACLGPLAIGIAMDSLGGRGGLVIVLAVGLAGAALFALLRHTIGPPARGDQRRTSPVADPEEVAA
jgi:MFS family permease